MQTIRRTGRAAIRAAVLATAALASALCGIVPAQAAPGDGIAGYPSARQTVRSEQLRDTVSRFLISARQHGSAAPAADGGPVGAPVNAPAKGPAAPGFVLKDPVPMYEISPEFVAGGSRATPRTALRLSYLASRVTAADGTSAAVLLAPKRNAAAMGSGPQQVGAAGWELAAIRDGENDVRLAERGTPQSRAFTEPQIHAWYRLTAAGTVEPLNKEATAGLGGKRAITLAAYQRLVNARYGDKLPGSAYDRKGMAGGYGGLMEAESKESQQPDQSDQVAAASGIPAVEPSRKPLAVAGAAALAAAGALGGAAVYVRRRRTTGSR
ncbi:hypothetical protein ACM614_10945 [Streptomyces sp. 12297]